MNPAPLLIVDDNPAVRSALDLLFSLHGLHCVHAASPAQALQRQQEQAIDLVIQDMNFGADTTSGAEGIALFHELRRRDPDLPIILLTGWTSLETAVELVKAGAADYLGKPWDNDKLVVAVKNLLALRHATGEHQRLVQTRARARSDLAQRYELCGLVYESESLHEVVSLACRVARSDLPVLITGPSGAGKEKIAEILQHNSAVAQGPYVRVNLGAIPRELVSAELFGAEAGAYTGATRARPGRFEAADGGTLFLDEIGTLSAEGQVKLLRVLQTGEFERLGSTQPRRAQVRVISATNSDLKAAIAAGNFREDLYYRLNGIELRVPPLSERAEDIAPLAHAFLDGAHQLSEATLETLSAHDWPGNVRELQNCIRRACLLAAAPAIQPADLGLPGVRAAVAEPDRDSLQRLLDQHGGSISAVARELGLTRQALYRRLEKFGLKSGS